MMLKSKIIIGIIVAIAIIVGIGYSTSDFSNNNDSQENSLQDEQIVDESEGKKFTLQLDDSVSAVGP